MTRDDNIRMALSSWGRRATLALALGLLVFTGAAHAKGGSGGNTISRIDVVESPAQTEIAIVAAKRPTFTVFKLSNPQRLFIDIVDADVSNVEPRMRVRNGVISEIVAQSDRTGDRHIGRIVVAFDTEASYDIRTEGTTLKIVVDGARRDTPDLRLQRAKAEAARLERAIERERSLLAELKQARVAEDKLRKRAETARAQEEILVRRIEAARKEAERLRMVSKTEADRMTAELEQLKAQQKLEKEKQQALARAVAAEKARKSAVEDERQKAEALRKATERALATEQSRLAAARAATKRAQQEREAAEAAAKAAADREIAARKLAAAEKKGDSRKARSLKRELSKKDRELSRAQAELARKQKALQEARLAQAQAEQKLKKATAERVALERERRKAAEVALAQEQARSKALQQALAQAKAPKAAAQSERAQEQLAELQSRLDQQRSRVAKASEQAEVEQARIALLKNQLEGERAELAKLKKQREGEERRLASLKKEVASAEKKADAAHSRANAAEQRAAQAERKARLMAEKAATAQKIVDAAEKAGASSDKLDKMKETAALAQSQAARAAKEAREAQAEVDSLRAKNRELDQQLEREAAARKDAEARASKLEQQLKDKQLAEARKHAAADAARPVVRDVKFVDSDRGGEVRIDLTGLSEHEVVRHGPRRLELKLRGATIPKGLERSLDTSDLGGPVKLVSSFRSKDEPGVVRVVVDLRSSAGQTVVKDGNTLVWKFMGNPSPHRAVAKRNTPGKRTPPGVRGYPGAVAAEGGGAVAPAGNNFLQRRRGRSKKYKGKKINLTIKDADIQHVLTFLAKEGGVNIVASDKVKGKVTFHLENIPWDLALDMILKTQGYDYVKEAGVYRVAPAEDIREEFEAELKKKQTIRDLKPMVVRFITVNYADLEDLQTHIKTVLSKTGTVSVDQSTSTLIVKDVEEHVQAAEDIVRRLDVQLPQVLIEARIVEASTSFSQEVGIQWGGNFTMAPAFGNPTGLAFPSIIGVSGGADAADAPTDGLLSSNPNFAVNLPAAVGTGAGGALGLTLGSLGGSANINLRLSAAEQRGSVKIISAPKILTIDGNKAVIKQGVSIPVPVVSANGVNTQFFNADLKLEVLTNTSPDGNIRLDIDITKNEPDFGQTSANGAPTIQKKEAKTSLLVRDGETTVIGGIYTRNTGESTSGIPVISQIPILGWFFKNHSERDNRSELLIFITPRVANRRASVVGGGPGQIAP